MPNSACVHFYVISDDTNGYPTLDLFTDPEDHFELSRLKLHFVIISYQNFKRTFNHVTYDYYYMTTES